MVLILGLGNPGKKYEQTRHNMGFAVVNALLAKLTPVGQTRWQRNEKLKAEVAKIDDLVLARPATAMNNSGQAVKLLKEEFNPSELWIVHDDLDVLLGKLKIAQGRGAAGHRGVTSVIEALGTVDFVRFRVGIGAEKVRNAEKFVLSPFDSQETAKASKAVNHTVGAIEYALEKGIEAAMNRYNQ